MARSARPKADDTSLHVSTQIDLFPVAPVVDVLDPRAVVGARTGVEHLVRVRPRPNDAPHLVFLQQGFRLSQDSVLESGFSWRNGLKKLVFKTP